MKYHPQANKLDMIAQEIGEPLRKYWRMPVTDMKYKHWTVRVYCTFGWFQFHDLFYPGYAYSQFPKWLWLIDCHYGALIMRYSGLGYISACIHKWAYSKQYLRILKKYPKFTTEIINGMDYQELLYVR